MKANILARQVRAFTTHSRPIRSQKFIEALLRETREPIWRLVTALSTPRSPDLSAALYRHNVSVDQFKHWRPFVVESSIATAADIMQHNNLVTHPAQSSFPIERHLPSWLVVYLISFKIRTIGHAHPTAFNFAYSHLPVAPISVQGPLLILTLLGLARFALVAPMHRVIDTFLTTNLDHPQLYFNLLLQAIACTPIRSVDLANAVVNVLKRMEARQLNLNPTTYQALLNDRFVTLQLTKHLRERMTREGIVPSVEHLESYLKIFLKHGKIHKSGDYMEAIQSLSSKSKAQDISEDPLLRANTLLLGAHDDRASAFTFLKNLLVASDTASKPSAILRTKQPLTPIQKSRFKSDIYTFTTALSVAAKDHKLSALDLTALFDRSLKDLAPAPPTVVTYTVLLQGLYARKDYNTASKYWWKLVKSGIPLDRESLGIGVRILTRSGKPHVAWSVLEQFAGTGEPYPSSHPSTTSKGAQEPSTASRSWVRTRQKPVQLSIVTINDFLVALLRIARPDVVFMLWDYMRVLYGVGPDSRTLSLLLQAARLTRRLDDSLGGVVVRLRYELQKPFDRHRRDDHTRTPEPGPSSPDAGDVKNTETATTLDTRSRFVHEITALLGSSSKPYPHPYRSFLWHKRLPHQRALLIFEQALFGAAPDPKKLLSMKPPAHAVREHSPTSAMDTPEGGWGLFVGLPGWNNNWIRQWNSPDLFRDLLRRRRVSQLDVRRGSKTEVGEADGKKAGDGFVWDTYHPTVTPTAENFFNYILLLGLTGRGTEIARVLGWMREVGIQPPRYLLGAALVFWREVCASRYGPLVERWRSRARLRTEVDVAGAAEDDRIQNEDNDNPQKRIERNSPHLGALTEYDFDDLWEEKEGGEYAKLVAWLVDWVGEKRLPENRDMAVWERNIARAREGGRQQLEVEEGIEQARKASSEQLTK